MSAVLSEHLALLATAPDGIQKLRGLILELAVRGKLVPQDPNDESASELLKQISEERKPLEADGTYKKSKPLPPVRIDEQPFVVPDGWAWVRLGQIGDTNIGLTYSPSDISNTGTPVLRSSNVQNGLIDLSDLVRVEMVIKESALVREGDLLICARNGSKALVGKTAMITGLAEKMAFGAFMAIFRSRFNSYLLYFINSPLFRRTIDDVNTTTINQITQSNLRETALPLPPLTEQRRIVAKVDELMALCARLEAEQADAGAAHARLVDALLGALIQSTDAVDLAVSWQRLAEHFDTLFTTKSSLDALKQIILQLAVMGKLVAQDSKDEPASELLKRIAQERALLEAEGIYKKSKAPPTVEDDEQPYRLPKGWSWCRFGNVVAVNGNLVDSLNYPEAMQVAPDSIEKGTGRLIEHRTVREAGVRGPNQRFKAGQLLYSKIRPSLSKAVIVDFDGLCSADMYPLDSFITPKFLLYQILSETFLQQVRVAENRVKMPKLNQESLNAFLVCIPPLAEQHRIVAKVDELLALCDRLKADLTESRWSQERLASTLIQSALQAG